MSHPAEPEQSFTAGITDHRGPAQSPGPAPGVMPYPDQVPPVSGMPYPGQFLPVSAMPYPPPFALTAPPSKARPTMVVGVVLAALLLAIGVGATGYFLLNGRPSTDDGLLAAPFGGTIGDVAQFHEGANEWSVAVTRSTWFDLPCGSLSSAVLAAALPARIAAGRILVLDVRFSVTAGRRSLSDATEFEFTDVNGEKGHHSTGYGCAEPFAGSTVSAGPGRVLQGQIAFEVGSGKGGKLSYRPADADTVAWTVPN